MIDIEVLDLYKRARENSTSHSGKFHVYEISEDGSLFVVAEVYQTSENSFCYCYHPYVAEYTPIFKEYFDFDDAMLAALAIKFNGKRSCLEDDRIYFAREVLGAKKVNKNE